MFFQHLKIAKFWVDSIVHALWADIWNHLKLSDGLDDFKASSYR